MSASGGRCRSSRAELYRCELHHATESGRLALVPLQRTYSGQTCSVAAALEVVGERWTMLIIREALLGVHRFDEMQADLGIARNVLQSRLEHLVAEGILSRRLYQQRPER